MQLDQVVRRATHGIGQAFGSLGRGLKLDFRIHGFKGVLRVALAVVALIAAYYVVGSILMRKVDADLKLAVAPETLKPGQSRTVAIAAALIDREVNKDG